MKRLMLLLTLLLLPGCDVAVAAYLASQDKSSSDDDAPAPLTSPGYPQPVSKVFVGQIPDTATADQELQKLIDSNGNPDTDPVTGIWTELGVFTATDVFDPDNANLPPFNTILVAASSTRNYEIDCIEILDGNNAVVAYASTPVWSNLVDFQDEIEGPPDGVPAVTTAVADQRAFIFSIYTGPIDKFRINGHPPATPSPGDVIAVGRYINTLVNERPGGLAIDSEGEIFLTLSVGDVGRIEKYDLTGARVGSGVDISADLATAGIHSLAINSSDEIFTACSNGTGVIQVLKFDSNLGSQGSLGFTSGFNGDRVEHNSIAIDGSGNVVVVGGFSSLLSGRNHFRAKMPSTLASTTWQSTTSLDSSNTTYWHAVTTGASDEVFMAGDLFSGSLLGGTTQLYTGQFTSAGVGTWDDAFAPGEQPADIGHAIQLDSAGNIFVAGSAGKTSGGRDALIVRYTPGGASVDSAEFIGQAGADDEILDLAIDTDGSIYAVGYENVTGQGENWWVRKLSYDTTAGEFDTVWQRTHHGGFGNDRAVSVAINGTYVVVAGFETNNSAQTKLVMRIYEK